MASEVVADSGIFLATALEESLSEQSVRLIDRWRTENIQILAPTLLRYEVISVIRKKVHRGVLTSAQATAKRDNLLAMMQTVRFEIDDSLLRRAYELAEQLNRPTAYDSQYLALAERLNCEFWTVDEKLYNAVHEKLAWVKWVGGLPD